MNKYEILNIIKQYSDEAFKVSPFIPGLTPVPTSGAVLSSDDIVNLVSVVLNGWITEYREASRFKATLSSVCKKEFVQLCNSGSSANLLAISSAKDVYSDYPQKRYIITTALSFPTTIAPIYQNNLIPLFVDIDPLTFEPNYDQILDFIIQFKSEKILGIILTHTLGFPFCEEIIRNDFLKRLNDDAIFISDCCDALGAKVNKDFPVGYYADISTLSFFPSHQITTGEGGAILTNREDVYKSVRSFANWGRDCWCLPGQNDVCGKRFGYKFAKLPDGFDHKYTFTKLGYNLKMTDLQASLGNTQIARLDYFSEKRRKNFEFLRNVILNLEDHFYTVFTPNIAYTSPFGFPIILKRSSPALLSELISFLESRKIHTRRLFGANMTRQPVLNNLPYIHKPLDGSDYLMNNAIWVGCWHGLTQQHLDYIAEALNDFVRRF